MDPAAQLAQLEALPEMSKSQRKKMLKRAAIKEQRQHKREQEKAERRERTAAKADEDDNLERPAKRQRKEPKSEVIEIVVEPRVDNVTVAVDCAFDSLMTGRELSSLAQQIQRCYSVNRKSKLVKLSVTGLKQEVLSDDKLTLVSRMELDGSVQTTRSCLERLRSSGWHGVEFRDEPLLDVHPPSDDHRLIYLTAESDQVLDDAMLLPGNLTLVVGGLVDKNRHKGLCHDFATTNKIQTARLPIDEYVRMSAKRVLTTNHVVEILVKYLACRDWERAFLDVIPQRNLQQQSTKSDSGDSNSDELKTQDAQDGYDEQ